MHLYPTKMQTSRQKQIQFAWSEKHSIRKFKVNNYFHISRCLSVVHILMRRYVVLFSVQIKDDDWWRFFALRPLVENESIWKLATNVVDDRRRFHLHNKTHILCDCAAANDIVCVQNDIQLNTEYRFPIMPLECYKELVLTIRNTVVIRTDS